MSNEDPIIKLHRIPRWVLSEPVDVTLIIDNPDAVLCLYLVARVNAPGAITVQYSEDGIVINGASIEDSEVGTMMLCDIADYARGEMTEHRFDGWSYSSTLPLGKTVRIDPENREATTP
jgi:hypothetical protein